MAYVAINKNLTDNITDNINRMADAERASEPEPMRPDINLKTDARSDEWRFLSAALWGPLAGTIYEGHPDLVWKRELGVNITISDFDPPPKNNEARYNNPVRLLVTNAPAHASATTQSSYDRDFYMTAVRADHPFFEDWSNWCHTTAETTTRWAGITKQIISFIAGCKSLNEALKLWPDVRRYCPRDALDKVDGAGARVKAEKKPSEALARLAAMDLETIASSTVIARLVGGSS